MNAEADTREMSVDLVRDYHMDPEKAEETGEDPVDMILAPELDYGEFPYRVLDLLECNYLHGEYAPAEEDLPDIGSSTPYGTVEFTEDGDIVSFTPADD